jgi:dTDP-4-amino-4,6-dideoxygalactose transaminase
MCTEPVSFLDLISLHRELEEQIVGVVRQAISTGRFIGGPMVEGFEADFGRFCGSRHCLGVHSGTDALRFALLALKVGPGDCVLTVPNTFIATTEAISQVGATPEFVDIDPDTYTMGVGALRRFIEKDCIHDARGCKIVSRRSGKRVAAIIPVHLYGQCADMDPILELGSRYGLAVIEDACQAHGAQYFSHRQGRWRTAGTMGAAAAFSFYPGKNLGALGEGGAVTTDDERIAAAVALLRDHGQAEKYIHHCEGYNGRLDAIQAGILQLKLGRLCGWNEARRAAAARYGALLRGIDGVALPAVPAWSRPVFHLYVIRVGNRDAVQRFLQGRQIGTGLHYPLGLHRQQAYRHLAYEVGDFPVCDAITPQILSLPMFPGLTAEQQGRVAQTLSEALREQR